MTLDGIGEEDNFEYGGGGGGGGIMHGRAPKASAMMSLFGRLYEVKLFTTAFCIWALSSVHP